MNSYVKLLLLVAVAQQPGDGMSMRRIARLPFGPLFDPVVCCDSDHDSLPELIFRAYYTPGPCRMEFWEHQDWNRFRLVYADTGAYPEPNGITTGNAVPYDAGDVDGDGLTDIVCSNFEFFNPDSVRDITMTLESPDSHSYPSLLSWYYPGCMGVGLPPVYIRHDFEHDGHNVIFSSLEGKYSACIWRNAGNDSNEMVWRDSTHLCGGYVVFRDFDGSGRSDVACGGFRAEVWEDTGNCQLELVWEDTFDAGNGPDVWSTSDIDGSGQTRRKS